MHQPACSCARLYRGHDGQKRLIDYKAAVLYRSLFSLVYAEPVSRLLILIRPNSRQSRKSGNEEVQLRQENIVRGSVIDHDASFGVLCQAGFDGGRSVQAGGYCLIAGQRPFSGLCERRWVSAEREYEERAQGVRRAEEQDPGGAASEPPADRRAEAYLGYQGVDAGEGTGKARSEAVKAVPHVVFNQVKRGKLIK